MGPEYLTTKEFAALVRRSERTVELWRASGKGPPVTVIQGKPLYAAADVQAWIAAQQVSRAAAP